VYARSVEESHCTQITGFVNDLTGKMTNYYSLTEGPWIIMRHLVDADGIHKSSTPWSDSMMMTIFKSRETALIRLLNFLELCVRELDGFTFRIQLCDYEYTREDMYACYTNGVYDGYFTVEPVQYIE
jgi:hypothetical protein